MDDEQAQTTELPEQDDQKTQENNPVAPTEQIPAAQDRPSIDTEPASLHDVATAAGSFARGHMARVQAFLSSHALFLVIAAALAVAAILGIGFLVRSLTDYPDASAYRKDAQSLLATPAYNGGTYGSDDPLLLSDFEVTGQQKEAKTPSQCLVHGIAHYQSSAVEALQEAKLTYARQDGEWKCIGAEPVGSASYTATAGPVAEKLLSNVSGVLQRAEASFSGKEGGIGLPTLYSGATATIADEAFDADSQTYSATLHLSRAATFTAYECDVRTSFAFRRSNGLWELTAATASTGAKDITLTPLVGNWVGSFQEQTAEKGKCFGAKTSDLRINVTTAANGRIAGTISGIAHYHGELSSDADQTDGDTELVDVPFSGTLLHQGDGITFSCTTPEDASGTVSLALAFGTQSDPSAATATLTTTHMYEGSFLFFAYDRETTFSDTFVLTRQ